MANVIQDPSEPLDYRYGGETWDSWALKYMQTIPYIFRVLNAINGTGDLVLPEPEGAGAIVRKNADGTVDITITGNCTGNAATATRATKADSCTGNAATATKLANPRNIELQGAVTGLASFDGSKNIVIRTTGVSGNASHIINKQVDGAGITDGTILVYRQGQDKFVMESKGTVGAGKTLKVLFGEDVLGTFNGDKAETIDLKPLIREVLASVLVQFERRQLLEIDEEGNLSPKSHYDPMDIQALIDRSMLFTVDDDGNIVPKGGR